MSSLEELKKKLYQKGVSFRARRGSPELSFEPSTAPPSWKESNEFFLKKRGGRRVFLVFIIFAIVFLLFVVATGFYLLFGSGGFISSKAIDLDIQVPPRINGGDKVSLRVNVTDRERASLESADLIIEYPPVSQPIGLRDGQLKQRRSLGKILPGETVGADFEVYVFGEEGSEKNFKITLEYRMEGSSAIFVKETERAIRIVQSTVGISINLPEEIKVGQEVSFKIQYVSNSPSDLEKLSLVINYPEGFEFKSADPKPSEENNQWFINRLNQGFQAAVIVRGEIKGEDLEKKIFHAAIGRKEDDAFEVYGKTDAGTTLRRPFLDIFAIRVNGQEEANLKAGEVADVEIMWKNNLPVAVKNMIIEAKLSGAALSQSSIFVDRGFFRGADQMVVWNASTFPQLSFVEPGEEGTSRLKFNVLSPLPIYKFSDTRFVVSLVAYVFASEIPEGFNGVDIESQLSKDIKISSEIQLARRGLYYSGPLSNQGPLPPRVDSETTYTIVWSIINSANDVKNATIKASLPPYISWKNVISSPSESIIYESASGEIAWNIGELKAGTGIIRPAREAAFQIGFVPAMNQIGSSPILVTESVLEGEDTFTGVRLRGSRPAVTTELYGADPQVSSGQGKVIQ